MISVIIAASLSTNMQLLKRFLILSVAVIPFLFSCNVKEKISPGSSVVEGRIENASGGKIYFCTYADSMSLYIDNKTALDSSVADKDGHYSFILHNQRPLVFNIQNGNVILANNLFLEPGNRLEINFKGNENKPVITSSGPGSGNNSFLIQFLDSFFYHPEVKNEYYIASNFMDIHQFSLYIESRKQKQLDFFYNYFENDSTNSDFKKYVLNTINYGIGSDKLYYLWKKRMKIENIRGDSAFFSFETKTFIQNPDAMNCPAYIRFLNLYIKDTYERMVEQGEFQQSKTVRLIPQAEKYKLAVRLLERPYRDAVLYNLIHDEMNEIGQKSSTDSVSLNSLDSMIRWFCKKYAISNS